MLDKECCCWLVILLEMFTGFLKFAFVWHAWVALPAYDWESENILNKTYVEKCQYGFTNIKRSEFSKKVWIGHKNKKSHHFYASYIILCNICIRKWYEWAAPA